MITVGRGLRFPRGNPLLAYQMMQTPTSNGRLPGYLLSPNESAKSLYDHGRAPKEIIWHKSKHVMPGELEIVKELTEVVVEKVYKEHLDTGDRETPYQTRARSFSI